MAWETQDTTDTTAIRNSASDNYEDLSEIIADPTNSTKVASLAAACRNRSKGSSSAEYELAVAMLARHQS